MNRRPPESERSDLLRRLAEEQAERAALPDPATLSPAQVRELLHELQVHQIQLEMQNGELETFQRKTEAARDRYRLLYDSAPLGYVTLDSEGTIEDPNRAVLQILGRSRSELVGRRFSDFIASADQDAWQLLRKRLMRSDQPESCELRLLRNAGEMRHVEVVGQRDGEGERQVEGSPAAIRLALMDMTERRAAERALRHAASQAALAEHRERRQLAVDLHDDLGQTLQLASLKLKRFADAGKEEQEEGINAIIRLLEEARERVSSLSFQLSPPVLYDVGLVAAAEWLADDLERRYGLVVTITQGDEPEAEEAARVTLYRALRELLVNVAKHSGVHEAHVRIWQEDGAAFLEVTDGGKGFNPQEARKGFGLLALRERVGHLGGSVKISSADGSGARVLISMPRPESRAADGQRRGAAGRP